MFWEFIIPLIVVLVFCYCLMPKFKYGVDRQIMKTNKFLNEITLNDLRNEYGNNDLVHNNPHINKDMSNHNNNKKTQVLNNPPELRLDTCSAMKVNACPVGSYKQCTNNVLKHPKCDCSDQKSFEVCSNNDMNDLLTMDEVLQNEAKAHGKYAIRVNKWAVDETKFNDPGNLHIQRTNPYVEEL
jgi:hypothetical protein